MDLCNILFWRSRFKGDETDWWWRSTHYSSSASVRVCEFWVWVSLYMSQPLLDGLAWNLVHTSKSSIGRSDASTLHLAPPFGKKKKIHLPDPKFSSFLSALAYCVVKSKSKNELLTEVIKKNHRFLITLHIISLLFETGGVTPCWSLFRP